MREDTQDEFSVESFAVSQSPKQRFNIDHADHLKFYLINCNEQRK